MTQFNIQRMKQYAQWQLATHRATLLKITGVATSAFILMFLFVKYVSHRDLQTQSDDLTLLWIGCFAFCGVQVFPNLLSKQERTSLLMLPASNAEKFLTSYIGVLLTAFVVPLVSFFVADVVQWLISLLTDHKQALLLTPLAFSDALDLLSKFFGENAQIAWAGLPNILWLHSFYLLSGLFFNKRGMGYFVAEDARHHIAQRRQEEFMETTLPELFRQMRLLNIGIDEVAQKWEESKRE